MSRDDCSDKWEGTVTVPRKLLAEAYRGLKRHYEMPELRKEIDALLSIPASTETIERTPDSIQRIYDEAIGCAQRENPENSTENWKRIGLIHVYAAGKREATRTVSSKATIWNQPGNIVDTPVSAIASSPDGFNCQKPSACTNPACSCPCRMSEAKDFSIVMAYEAFRICLGLSTRTHCPADVLRWMRLLLRHDQSKTGVR